jgi:hypothetical protein
MMMKKFTLLLMVGTLSLALFGCSQETPTGLADGSSEFGEDKSASGFEGPAGNYEVIVENMTPATGAGSSQPFSPPILATHKGDFHVFQAGSAASDELAQLAEDAVSDPLVDMLHASDRVQAVAMGGGVILPGGDMRLEIEASPGSRNLSAVFMLVNTNDAFGGLDCVKFPLNGEATYWVHAMDAGSEENTELATDIPGPCCGSPGMGTDEFGVVRAHEGILGVGDLDAEVFGWEGAIAKVTVRRID